jgi:hypothetical protein
MDTLAVILVSFVAYSVVIFGFLRFLGYLSDRDAEIRKLLSSQLQKKLKHPIHKKRLKLAR